METKIKALAKTIEDQSIERLKKDGMDCDANI